MGLPYLMKWLVIQLIFILEFHSSGCVRIRGRSIGPEIHHSALEPQKSPDDIIDHLEGLRIRRITLLHVQEARDESSQILDVFALGSESSPCFREGPENGVGTAIVDHHVWGNSGSRHSSGSPRAGEVRSGGIDLRSSGRVAHGHSSIGLVPRRILGAAHSSLIETISALLIIDGPPRSCRRRGRGCLRGCRS